jgi:redox-sensitive bicupin YhaK (pirin superfamily)
MTTQRKPGKILESQPIIEGAGVHLNRVFGFQQAPQLDPFLLLDDFHSDNPAHYRNGFPSHPHRGIETITYVLRGSVTHEDSMGNRGKIESGDVQWMTAGSGIIHQEMPHGDAGGALWGLQLWANLPASHKMMDPRYREVKSGEIPEIELPGGVKVKVICGEVNGVRGPVRDIVIDPEYLDVTVPPGAGAALPVRAGHLVFAYVLEGSAYFEKDRSVEAGAAVMFDDGDEVAASAGGQAGRFLLVSGKPLREPLAWSGPIVMNTRGEVRKAFEEYESGNFIKAKA